MEKLPERKRGEARHAIRAEIMEDSTDQAVRRFFEFQKGGMSEDDAINVVTNGMKSEDIERTIEKILTSQLDQKTLYADGKIHDISGSDLLQNSGDPYGEYAAPTHPPEKFRDKNYEKKESDYPVQEIPPEVEARLLKQPGFLKPYAEVSNYPDAGERLLRKPDGVQMGVPYWELSDGECVLVDKGQMIFLAENEYYYFLNNKDAYEVWVWTGDHFGYDEEATRKFQKSTLIPHADIERRKKPYLSRDLKSRILQRFRGSPIAVPSLNQWDDTKETKRGNDRNKGTRVSARRVSVPGPSEPEMSSFGSTEEEVTKKLGDPIGYVGPTPYWKLPDGSALIIDSPSRGSAPMALRIQKNGIHSIVASPGKLVRIKMRWDPEKGFTAVEKDDEEPAAPRMTEEELLRGLEGLTPPEDPAETAARESAAPKDKTPTSADDSIESVFSRLKDLGKDEDRKK